MSKRFTQGFVLVALVVVFAILLSACGGSDNTSAANSGSSNSGSTSTGSSNSGSDAMGTTVNIKESKGSDGKDVYKFDQTTLSVKKGDKVTFKNMSDELQDIDGGDASKAGIDVKVPVNQEASATFNTAGTFTISSEKGATMTVTVQ